MGKYKVYALRNYRKINQMISNCSDEQLHAIDVVGQVLPFKVNNYVIDELIDWQRIPDDPIFQLTFPQKEMLSTTHFREMEEGMKNGLSKSALKVIANRIRWQLNPHPANQAHNIPEFNGTRLTGIQHKYRETVLFFPSNSQTCHAYCTFCFRWPQFVGLDEVKFAMKETDLLVDYVRSHKEVTNILFTGGDPMVMSAKKFAAYIDPILDAEIPHLKSIRIGTKALGYWPYRFLTDKDADDILRLFEKVASKGYHLAFMAHFNHSRELHTDAVKKAIKRIQNTGAVIRSQSPVMKHINDKSTVWRRMWQDQASLGIVPYYMFVARDTGAQDYFAVSLEKAWKIYRKAYQQVSGLARTVRGPSMSCEMGKVQVLGVNEINGDKVFTLRFLQARNPKWVGKPFFAQYDPDAIWMDELKPAFGRSSFFFEEKSMNGSASDLPNPDQAVSGHMHIAS